MTTYSYVLRLKDKMSGTLKKVGAKGNSMYSRLEKSQKRLNRLTKKFAPISNRVFAGVGAASVGIFTGKVIQATQQTTEMAAKQYHLAQRLGVSTKAFTELSYAAGQYNVKTEALRDGLKEMQLRVHEFVQTGRGPAKDMLEMLNLSHKQLASSMNDPMELFELLRSRIQEVDNAAAKQRIADEIFGGQGGEQLVRFLGISSQELANLRNEAEKTGSVFGDKVGKKMVEYQQQTKKFQGVIRGLKMTLTTELLPTMSKYLNKMTSWIQSNKELVSSKIKTFVTGLANTIKWLGENMSWLKPLILGLVGAMTALKIASMAVNVALRTQ